jgi:gliding motility-associated-like protein
MGIIGINKWLLLLTPFFGFSQTINTGTLYIGSGTQMSSVAILDNKVSGDLVNDGELFVYSHYNNDGLVTFTTGNTTGITRMRGMFSYQNVSGNSPMEWNNVEFNNSKAQPAFHLSNRLSIYGKANFYQGIVDDDAYGGLVVFENGSNHKNTSNESFVDGQVRKNGNDAFVYPIGDKSKYRFSGISAPDKVVDAFSGKYFFESANPLYPLINKDKSIVVINDKEYWTLNKNAGVSGAMLTLSWDDLATTPESIVMSPQTAIHIVRWDAAKSLWIDEGGVVDSDAKTVSTPVNVSGYSVFTTARVKDGLIPNSYVIYNAISPDDDGVNDYLRIDGLTGTENSLEIYNRWGVLVYETSSYDTKGNVFKGISDGRVTINRNEKLPVGTYFYVLKVKQGVDGNAVKKTGYLYINAK